MAMKYNKIVKDGYIFSISIGGKGIEISREEYKAIQNALKNVPEKKEGYASYLKDEDLTWVSIAI